MTTSDTPRRRPSEVPVWQTDTPPAPAQSNSRANRPEDTERTTKAERLYSLARAQYDPVADPDGRLWVVPYTGAKIARPLEGRGTVASSLAEQYRAAYDTLINTDAIAAVVRALQGEAISKPAQPVYLRAADCTTSTGRRLTIDLGRDDGQLAVVTPGRVQVTADSPHIFYRNQTSAPLPLPAGLEDTSPAGPALTAQLAEYLNAPPAAVQLLAVWCAAALLDIERPLLWLTGQQGTGKSHTARTLVQLLDPSRAPLRTLPTDSEDWQRAAVASRVIAIDNLSRLTAQWSDTFCRAVTGDSFVRRQRFTDNELSVGSYRLALICTSINPLAARGDLAQRLLPIELQPLEQTRSARQLTQQLEDRQPALFGTLLRFVADIFAAMHTAPARDYEAHRLADWAAVLAAADSVTGWHTLEDYCELSADTLADLLDSSAVGAAIAQLLEANAGRWSGSVRQLLDALEAYYPDNYQHRPTDPTRLAARIREIEPTLNQHRIIVTRHRTKQGVQIELASQP